MSAPILESVAKALVINNKNEVLILTLGEHKQQPNKSYTPDLPGGSVDLGESDRDGMVREVLEETGIKVAIDSATPVYSKTEFYDSQNKSISKHLFVVRLDSTPEVVLSWEHTSYEWIPLDDLHSIDLRSFYGEAVQYCLSRNIV